TAGRFCAMLLTASTSNHRAFHQGRVVDGRVLAVSRRNFLEPGVHLLGQLWRDDLICHGQAHHRVHGVEVDFVPRHFCPFVLPRGSHPERIESAHSLCFCCLSTRRVE